MIFKITRLLLLFLVLMVWIACAPAPEPVTLATPASLGGGEPAVSPTTPAADSDTTSGNDGVAATLPPPQVIAEATATPVSAADDGTADNVDPTPAAQYAVVGVEPGDTLNMRSGPGVENDVVGEIPNTGVNIELLSEPVMVEGSPWREVRYDTTSGWVNTLYLAEQSGTPVAEEIRAVAVAAIDAIQAADYAQLAAVVHPQKGVRFSPYTFVREEDVVFSPAEVATLAQNDTVYLWGRFDGTGDPIELPFDDYYLAFVYDVEFAWPDMIGFDEFIGYGNTINNIRDFYPEGVVIEYHFPGFDPQYDGMDWRSLRLVFEQENGVWYLVGVVHSEWTI